MIMRRLWAVRRVFLTVAATLLVLTSAVAGAQAATGEENFNKTCVACHTIGGGVRVGPDLKGVNERRTEAWLLRFITSSQAVVRSGDPVAVALFAEFHDVVMPDAPLSENEIRDVLAFIKGNTGNAPAAAPMREATPEEILKGLELFQGTLRFANGGPACNSCHHVKNDAVIGGGVLARELTDVFGRMGAPGIHAILGKPPFPVMDEAFRDRPLTEGEVFALVGFLQDADRHQAFQQPRDYGFKLFYSGAAGFVVLMALYALFGRGRKKYSVNHKIFERQVKTQ
jgi:cytochrome c2